jgi:hypothetical protein
VIFRTTKINSKLAKLSKNAAVWLTRSFHEMKAKQKRNKTITKQKQNENKTKTKQKQNKNKTKMKQKRNKNKMKTK